MLNRLVEVSLAGLAGTDSSVLVDFYRNYIVPEYDNEYQESFRSYAARVGRFFYVFFAHVAIWATLVTWPIDYYFYASRPQLFQYVTIWRSATVLIGVVILLIHYFGNLSSGRWSDVFFSGVIGMTCALYYSLSEMGGLDEPWFYSAYCLPLIVTFFINLSFKRRILYSVGLPLAAVVIYFGTNPGHFDFPFVASPLTLLSVFTVLAVILGQVFHNLFKRSYIQTLRLEDSVQEKDTLLEEVHHRVKNNLQTISSMLTLQYRQQDSRETRELLKKSVNRIKSMAFMHEHLYESESLSALDLDAYVGRLCNFQLELFSAEERITINREVENVELNLDQAVTCGLLVNELVSNALEHGFEDREEGVITVSLTVIEEDRVQLVISDNGKGIDSPDDLASENTTGIQIVRSLLEHGLEGSLEFQNGSGLTVYAEFNV